MFIGDVEVLGSEHPGVGWASGSRCVRAGLSRMRVDGSWRSLTKTLSGDGIRLAASFARKSAASLSFWGT